MICTNGELWACRRQELEGVLHQVRAVSDKVEAAAARSITPANTLIQDIGSVRVLSVVGIMIKRSSWLTRFLGFTSTAELAALANEAAADDKVRAVVLRVDSPGGQADGTAVLADALFALRSRKPLIAMVEGLAGSAAYYAASQAQQIVAHRGSFVGAIGTYAILEDYSARFVQMGIKVHRVASTPLKGAGAVGTEVTPEFLSEAQRLVDALAAQFTDDVARGRGWNFEAAQAVSDGKVYIAARAKDLRLIDDIGNVEDLIADLVGKHTPPKATPRSAPRRATREQLEATYGCGFFSDWVLQQGLTTEAARNAWGVYNAALREGSSVTAALATCQ